MTANGIGEFDQRRPIRGMDRRAFIIAAAGWGRRQFGVRRSPGVHKPNGASGATFILKASRPATQRALVCYFGLDIPVLELAPGCWSRSPKTSHSSE